MNTMNNRDELWNDHYILGYCGHWRHEGEPICLSTFEFKGCWHCHHFELKDDCQFIIGIKSASEYFGVSKNTIHRWIKNDKLKSRLFKRVRSQMNFSAGQSPQIRVFSLVEEKYV